MNAYLTYGIIFVILLALELCYFKVADHFNIIDKPNDVHHTPRLYCVAEV